MADAVLNPLKQCSTGVFPRPPNSAPWRATWEDTHIADLPPDSNGNTVDYPGIPRWVKVFVIIAIALALLVVIILVTGVVHTPPIQHGP